MQDGAPAHTSKEAQKWCQKNLPNFSDETTYKDPALKTLDELRRRIRFAWKNVTLDMLKELAHFMSRRLENVRKNKGGHSGY